MFLIGAILILLILLGVSIFVSKLLVEKQVRMRNAKVSSPHLAVDDERFVKGNEES
jgi:uncharacterized membrane protein